MIKQILVLLAILTFVSCSSEVEVYEPWSVKNISQREERIALLMDKRPQSFNLNLKGATDGPYKIYLIGSNQQPNVTLNFNAGPIDTIITQAWKEQSCKIVYVPERVGSGQLDINLKLISPK